MGVCKDRSVNYLKTLGLNTIRHPEENIKPLMLLGEYNGERGIIGTLDQLVEDATAAIPQITSSIAANINGERTSKLPISLGISILGNIIGALGGNLGIKAAYENARKIQFAFKNVVRERANIVNVGDYIQSGEVKWEHIILQKYLFGKGNLYVLTEVVRSDEVGVTAYTKDKSSLAVEVPVIKEIVGGNISVGHEAESMTEVAYKGNKKLAFGFLAIELSAGERGDDGDFDLVFKPVKAGTIFKSVDSGGAPETADFDGAMAELKEVDPQVLGEG